MEPVERCSSRNGDGYQCSNDALPDRRLCKRCTVRFSHGPRQPKSKTYVYLNEVVNGRVVRRHAVNVKGR